MKNHFHIFSYILPKFRTFSSFSGLNVQKIFRARREPAPVFRLLFAIIPRISCFIHDFLRKPVLCFQRFFGLIAQFQSKAARSPPGNAPVQFAFSDIFTSAHAIVSLAEILTPSRFNWSNPKTQKPPLIEGRKAFYVLRLI